MTAVPTPTPRELEILKVLWELGPSSVKAVHRHSFAVQDVAYNTIQTMLRLMAGKGLVSYKLDGRTFVYTPCFSRDESAARFLDSVFDGAASDLVLSLLRSERVGATELDAMQTMIADARRKNGKGRKLEGGAA